MNDSDNEENFIDLNDLIKEHYLYQIQINNEELIIKKIGKSKQSDDIIIYKNDKGLTLYSIVYSSEELKYNEDLGNIFNLMKIHEKVNNKDILFNIGIKINEEVKINKVIKDFKVFFLSNEINKNGKKYYKEFNKTVNKDNIVETMICQFMLMKRM